MTERTTALPRLAQLGGLGNRSSRDRLECLTIAAEAGGHPDKIVSRAEACVRHIEGAHSDEHRRTRWHCLRLASQTLPPPEDGDDIIRIATAFEKFISATD